MPINHEIIGAGPTIIFTPGWMMSRQVWERQRALATDFQLVFWDLPTQGPQGEALTLQHCAGVLHQLVETLRARQAAPLQLSYVGWSMGMSVFWQYLRDFGAGPFTQLINIEMVPRMDPKETRVVAVEQSLRRDRERATRKFIERIVHNVGAYCNTPLHDHLIKYALGLPLDSILSVYRDMAEADFTAEASGFSGRQHLAFGRHGFYRDQEALLRSFFPDDPLQWFEHSAHAPFWEEGEAFNEWVLKIL